MGELVNLKRFRKRADRVRAEAEANANRIKFGRTRSEREQGERVKREQDRVLDGHLRPTPAANEDNT